MEVFSIGTAQPGTAIRADLEYEMGLLHGQGLAVDLYEEDRGLYSFVDCRFEGQAAGDGENHARILRYIVANVIADLILNVVTKEMLNRIIRQEYTFFSPQERASILAEALSILNLREQVNGIPYRIYRRNQILAKVLRHLEEYNQLILEGFLRFQLKDYYEELKDAAERAVDRFMLQREYDEFIRLLRYFVDIQPPRIEEVNVLVKGGGMFSLLDEEGQPVEHEQLRAVLTDMGPEEIDYEDLLLSALITISPARVILHVIERLEVQETIERVFGDRVVICPGCPICSRW